MFKLKRLLRHVQPGGKKRSTPITLMSACTASFSEAQVLQAPSVLGPRVLESCEKVCSMLRGEGWEFSLLRFGVQV